MVGLKIETPGVDLASIETSDGWQITYHRLFNISPDEAPNVEVRGGGMSIWQLCFHEDLLHVVNKDRGLLLDVGWYPDSDPSGSFRLRLIQEKKPGVNAGRPPYDWQHPRIDYETRSLDQLLGKIHELVTQIEPQDLPIPVILSSERL